MNNISYGYKFSCNNCSCVLFEKYIAQYHYAWNAHGVFVALPFLTSISLRMDLAQPSKKMFLMQCSLTRPHFRSAQSASSPVCFLFLLWSQLQGHCSITFFYVLKRCIKLKDIPLGLKCHCSNIESI